MRFDDEDSIVDVHNTTIQLSTTDRVDRLRLIRSDNVGPRTFRSLLLHFGSARGAGTIALPRPTRRRGAPRAYLQ
jgi:DNA processing protein